MDIERLTRFLSAGNPESVRRLIAYRCSMVLLWVTVAITAAVCYQGFVLHLVDNGLLTTLVASLGIDATLAKYIFFRTPDESVLPVVSGNKEDEKMAIEAREVKAATQAQEMKP